MLTRGKGALPVLRTGTSVGGNVGRSILRRLSAVARPKNHSHFHTAHSKKMTPRSAYSGQARRSRPPTIKRANARYVPPHAVSGRGEGAEIAPSAVVREVPREFPCAMGCPCGCEWRQQLPAIYGITSAFDAAREQSATSPEPVRNPTKKGMKIEMNLRPMPSTPHTQTFDTYYTASPYSPHGS